MKITDVFALFDDELSFVEIDHSLDYERYAHVDRSRWIHSPSGRYVALVMVANEAGRGFDSWATKFEAVATYDPLPEALVFFLVGSLGDIPTGLAVQAAEEAGYQFVAAFPLHYDTIDGAIVALRTDQALTPARWLTGSSVSATRSDSARRALSQTVLADVVRRSALHDMDQLSRLRAQNWGSPGSDASSSEKYVRNRLRHIETATDTKLRSLEVELENQRRRTLSAEENYRSIRRSSAYRLGTLIGASLRNPLKAIWEFPAGLARIVRERPQARSQAALAREATLALTQPSSRNPTTTAAAAGMVSSSIYTPIPFPTDSPRFGIPGLVAFVSHPAFGGPRRSGWEFDLAPNSYRDALERLLPRLLIIESSAFYPGSPWAGAAAGVDPRRSQELADLVSLAGFYNIPVVFRIDTPIADAPVLLRFHDMFDLVITSDDRHDGVELSRGVQLGFWLDSPRQQAVRAVALISNSGLSGESWPPPISVETIDRYKHVGGDWQIDPLNSRTMANGHALKRAYRSVGLVEDVNEQGLTLPVLEALATGLPVLGKASGEFATVNHRSEVEMTDDVLNDLQEKARANHYQTARLLRREHSTAAEARKLGRLVGDPALSETGTVTLGLLATDETLSQASTLIDLLSTDIHRLVLFALNESGTAAKLALHAESNGIPSTLAHTEREFARTSLSLTPSTGHLWLLDSSAIPDDPVLALQRHLFDESAAVAATTETPSFRSSRQLPDGDIFEVESLVRELLMARQR